MARIVFMGSPEMAVPSLQALHEAGHSILAVVTQPDKPKGRGQGLAAPAVKLAAQARGLPVLQPHKVRSPEFIETLDALRPEFLAVVAYGKILPPEILKIPSKAPINLHFSLLPKYRGASCVAQALIQEDVESGVTTIIMDEGMDTGPILMQWSEPVLPEDTTGSLSQRLAQLGAQQLVKTLQEVEKGTVQAVPQSTQGVSLAPLLKKEMGHLDWASSAKEIYNLYRGLTPWPGVFSFLNGRRLLWTRLGPPERRSALPPGTLELASEGELFIHASPGALRVLQLKPEGKSVLSAEQFVRGLQCREGLILT